MTEPNPKPKSAIASMKPSFFFMISWCNNVDPLYHRTIIMELCNRVCDKHYSQPIKRLSWRHWGRCLCSSQGIHWTILISVDPCKCKRTSVKCKPIISIIWNVNFFAYKMGDIFGDILELCKCSCALCKWSLLDIDGLHMTLTTNKQWQREGLYICLLRTTLSHARFHQWWLPVQRSIERMLMLFLFVSTVRSWKRQKLFICHILISAIVLEWNYERMPKRRLYSVSILSFIWFGG